MAADQGAASGFELPLRRYADYAIRHRLKFNDGRGSEIEVGPSIIALLEMADLSVDFHGVDALVGDPKPGRHVPPCTCFNSPDKVEPLCPVHGDGVAASDREPAPDWIPYATDERPSDAMPQAGFEDWREQAKWWQDNAVYWRGIAQDAQHGRELARLDTERERSEADRYRAALERIYQQGRGPHVAIAREALDAS